MKAVFMLSRAHAGLSRMAEDFPDVTFAQANSPDELVAAPRSNVAGAVGPAHPAINQAANTARVQEIAFVVLTSWSVSVSCRPERAGFPSGPQRA